ncbi:MAG: FkbM family methyltransferase [Flavobacteriales bacterium]|nr:FkbM family methyltransferase [Flavobacteriales bacterium]
MKLSSTIYQTLLSIYKVAPFQGTWAHLLRLLPINFDRFYQDLHFNGTSIVHSKSGSFQINHRGSSIENQIFWKGLHHSFEEDTIWMWELLCKQSGVILDIGANTGVYSLIAKAENPKSRVIAFEPSRKMYPELLASVGLNNFDIECEKIALSNSSGNKIFFDSKTTNFPSSGSLSAAKLKDETSNLEEIVEYSVQCSTLDRYLTEKNVKQVDLIKIDIELHEPEFFEGFKSLQRFRPTIIVEILTEDIANRLKTIVDMTDYRLFRLVGINKMVELSEFSTDPNHVNHLLLPREKALPTYSE